MESTQSAQDLSLYSGGGDDDEEYCLKFCNSEIEKCGLIFEYTNYDILFVEEFIPVWLWILVTSSQFTHREYCTRCCVVWCMVDSPHPFFFLI